MLLYLSWICFVLLLITIAKYVLELGNDHVVVDTLQYFLAIPVVLGTFALRKVIANVRATTCLCARLALASNNLSCKTCSQRHNLVDMLKPPCVARADDRAAL